MTNREVWGDLSPQKLYDLLVSGKTYTQVAVEYDISRSTVSGQVFRWRKAGKFPAELPSTNHDPRPNKRKKPANPDLVKRVQHKTNVNLPPKAPAVMKVSAPAVHRAAPLPSPVAPPTNDPVDIMKLERGMCAVIVQDSPLLYCGCEPLAHEKYRMCEFHASTMVINEAERRRYQARRRAQAKLSK